MSASVLRRGCDCRLYRRHEAHFVEAIVDEHLVFRELRDERQTQMHDQRQRQKSMRDRAAERRGPRALGINVHELVIERHVGEPVDALLVDQEPFGHAELAADLGLKLAAASLLRHIACFSRP